MTSLQKRFAVLEHTPGDPFGRSSARHFDWMFESDGSLLTWATKPIDRLDVNTVLVAERLVNHRIVYLNFEGDIGKNRGVVVRRFQGNYKLIEDSEEAFVAEIAWQGKDQNLLQAHLEMRSGLCHLTPL